MNFSDIISSWTSRSAARAEAKRRKGRVVRAGTFANGSFGLYARQKPNGLYYGGCNPLITVWHVVKDGEA